MYWIVRICLFVTIICFVLENVWRFFDTPFTIFDIFHDGKVIVRNVFILLFAGTVAPISPGQSSGDSDDLNSSKRIRTAFTSTQLLELEREFNSNMYLSRLRRIEIATYLNLSEKQVSEWINDTASTVSDGELLKIQFFEVVVMNFKVHEIIRL